MTTLAPDLPLTPEERAIPNYRQQLKKALPKEIFEPDSKQLLWFLPHAAIISAGFWLLTNHFSWWIAPIVSLVIGHSMACMGFIAHDIAHGGTIKNLVLRDLLAGIGFSAFGIGPRLWRRWHNAEHHGNTQIEGMDPDHLFTMEDYKHNPVLKWLYRLSPLVRNIIIFSSFSYRMDQQTFRMLITYLKSPKSTTWEKLVLISQPIVQIGAWTTVTLLLGTQVFWWGYAIPLLVANTIAISYIATNHFLNPLADESDVLATSVSVTLNGPFKFLDPWHQYFGAHVAHHLFPQAPVRHTRMIDAKAKQLWPDRYHEMSIFKALQLLWKTPWIYEDHVTFVDPHRDIHVKTLGHGLEKELD